jgi:hypothetical protein
MHPVGLKRRSSSFNHPRLEHILDKGAIAARRAAHGAQCDCVHESMGETCPCICLNIDGML